MSFDAIIKIGPIVLLAGLVAMIYFYVRYRDGSTSDHTSSAVRYFGIALLVGIFAYIAGAAMGIHAACSPPSVGNLCGLYGVFGVGPWLAGIAIFLYALVWTKKAHRGP